MSEDLFYNDIDVLEKLRELDGTAEMTDFLPNIGSSITNNYTEQGSRRYGQSFMYNTFAVKQIPVTIKLIGMYDYFVRCQEWLGGLINQAKPAPLIRGLEPNKIWQAVPVGQSALAIDSSTSPPSATVTLTFDVPEATAENKVASLVTSAEKTPYGEIKKIAQGHFQAILKNNGTAEAFPVFTFTHTDDNGYIGLVNSESAYAVGNDEVSDTVFKSQKLIDYQDDKIYSGMDAATKNVAVLNDKKLTASASGAGAMHGFNEWKRRHLELANGNFSSLTWTIPADSQGVVGSLSDDIVWKQVFWCWNGNEQGYIKITVSDENDNFLYGVETIKRKYGLESEYNFLVTDGKGGYSVPSFTARKFKATHRDNENPFNHTRGASAIHRRDDKVKLYWWGSYHDITCPTIKGKKSAKIHVAIGKVGSAPILSKLTLDSFYYVKGDVSVDTDNVFPTNAVVKIDMSNGKSYLNGLNINDVVGGNPITLTPGNNTIDIYYSPWLVNAPSINIEWKERYI